MGYARWMGPFGLMLAGGCAVIAGLDHTYERDGEASSTASGVGGGGGAGGDPGGSNEPCEPGMTRICYEGPAGTEGVGECVVGTQKCKADGTGYEACVGQVIPREEDCATPDDESCDGSLEDGPPVCSGSVLWAEQMMGIGEQIPLAIAVDKDGNAVVAGVFEGAAEIGGEQHQSLGGTDAFLVKYNPDGSGVVFSLSFSGLEDQEARAVAVDKAGNTIVVGSFAESIHIGGPSAPLMSAGMDDIFVAKVSPGGSVLWKQQFGDMNNQRATGVAVDSTGNIYVAGQFEGTLTWGGTMLTSAGETDAFIAKLSPNGDPTWGYRSGDASAQGAEAVAVDNGDNVLLTGWFKGSIDMGGTKSATATDGFVAKLDSAGSLAWSKQIGGLGDAHPTAIAVDTSGDVIVAGHFSNLINIDSGGEEPAGVGEDSFLVKYTKPGEHSWHILVSTGDTDRIWSIAADSANNILLSGLITDATNFNETTVSYAGGNDAFLGKLDPGGVPIWLKAAGDTADQQGTSVAVAPNDDVLWAGQFKGKIRLGTSSFTSSDANDGFVARILE